jgi:AraC family transcriptional regulator
MDGAVAEKRVTSETPAQRRLLCRGFDVALLSTPAGIIKVAPSVNHHLSIHAGDPVRVTCRTDGSVRRRIQQRGEIEIVPAGLDGIWEDDDPATMLLLALTPGMLRATAEDMEVDPDRIALTPRFQLRDPRIEHLGWALKAELETGRPEERLFVESLGTALVAHLLRQYGLVAAPPRQGLSKWQRRRVVEYIDAHLDADLSLIQLAAIAGIGTTHFKMLFKQSLGLSVHQYVIRRRVEHARQLLLQGDRTIAEVALDSGFAHQSHLARWMQQLLGVTPAAVLRARPGQLAPVIVEHDCPNLLPIDQI